MQASGCHGDGGGMWRQVKLTERWNAEFSLAVGDVQHCLTNGRVRGTAGRCQDIRPLSKRGPVCPGGSVLGAFVPLVWGRFSSLRPLDSQAGRSRSLSHRGVGYVNRES